MSEVRSGMWRRAAARWAGALSIVAMAAFASGCAADAAPEDAAASALSGSAGQAVDDLHAAMDHRDEDNASLMRQLAQVQYALTDAQQRAYVKAFFALPEVAANGASLERAAASLNGELLAIMNDPQKLAEVLHTVTAYRAPRPVWTDSGLYDAFKLLTQTRYAATSLRFAAHLLGDDPAYTGVRHSHEDVIRDLVAPSLPTAFASMLVSTGSSRSALTQLESILDLAHGKCEMVAKWIESYRTFTGAYDTNPDLVKIENTSVGKSLKALGAVLAIWEVGDGVSALVRGNADDALQHFVKGGPDSVASLAEGVASLRRIFQGAEKTEIAESVVKIAGKVSGALTVVAGIIDTVGDLRKWNASDDAKVRVLGDLVGIGAGLVTLAGLSAGGWVLGVAALGITLVADFLRDQRLASQDRDQKGRVMPAVFWYDAGLARTIARANSDVLQTLHDELRMFAPDIQQMARVYPDGLTGERFPFMATQWVGLEVTQWIFGLPGSEVAKLMTVVAGTGGSEAERSYRVNFFIRYLAGAWDYDSTLSVNDALAWLKAQGSGDAEQYALLGSGIDAPTWEKMLADAATYLKSTQYEGPH
jgi:hypothetical protein